MPPKFIYFDMGNVLLYFDHHRAARQMAEVAGMTEAEVWQIVFGGDLQGRFERGEMTPREFFDEFCGLSGKRPDFDALERAGSDIFWPNWSIFSLVIQLRSAGNRVGVLSNTSRSHWEYCVGRYRLIETGFEQYALSFEIGAMKPDAAIYRAAAELAGVEPAEIFFTDDTAGHVAAARAAGFDAVQFIDTRKLVDELRQRGVKLNY
ncbi:MAG: HAD family phosphatase [Planctomycetes bacterium]|nr:HAD family phosphatase [Planctomycetota bacterium]